LIRYNIDYPMLLYFVLQEFVMQIVVYKRVSTVRQGNSGLGLEAQERAIESFRKAKGAKIVKCFTEVESGKRNNRPKLVEALHLAKVTGSTLVIAKLDRLSRNAAFLLALRDSGVRFIAADMPEANDLTIGIMALVAQQERETISKRTKEALAAAKARGVKLGNPNGAAALRRAGKGNVDGIREIKRRADEFASDLESVIEDILASGKSSLGGLADELNKRGILTPRGKRWYKSSVRNLLKRLSLKC
jgi:DNA invertase Pin-like site-specific DNA recombinase